MAAAPKQEPKQYKLGEAIPTFTAFDRATGDEVVVDERTFDEDLHSRKPVRPKAPAPPADDNKDADKK